MLLCALLFFVSPLDQDVRAKIEGFHGQVSMYAKNLKTGGTYNLAGGEPVRTASTIKLPIMIEAFSQEAEGKLKMTEPITLVAEEKVQGSGILADLTAGDVLPLRDMLLLMITMSDNTATNLLIHRLTVEAVNTRMAGLGLKQTRLMRKIGSQANDTKWGLGRSSPQEMVMLLEKLYKGELVNSRASGEMIEILKKQRNHNGIARDVKDAEVANKAGALDALRSDVGIVYTSDGPIAMAITVDGMETNWTPDNPGELMISALSELFIKDLH